MQKSNFEKEEEGGYWNISRNLAAYFQDPLTVVVLKEFIYWRDKFANKEGSFFYSAKYIMKNCIIKRKTLDRILKQLVDEKVITIELGKDRRNYFKINSQRIDEIISKIQIAKREKEQERYALKSKDVCTKEQTCLSKRANKGINLKSIKNKEEKKCDSSSSEFEIFKKHIKDNPYYKTFKPDKMAKKVFEFYNNLENYTHTYNSLLKTYAKKKPCFQKEGESLENFEIREENWQVDFHDYLERCIFKFIR
jgi:hypothetical protein